MMNLPYMVVLCTIHWILASDHTQLQKYENNHNESCYADSECPREMRCKEKDEINLCVCQPGYTFSNPFARCEPSKKIFRDFRIFGPTRINLTGENVYFKVQFTNSSHLSRKWQYEWLIQDGHEVSNFSGLNTSTLILKDLKPGFILFGISISNEEEYGYIPHNLTILSIDQPIQNEHFPVTRPIAFVRNMSVYLPTNFVLLDATESKNAVNFKWIPQNDTPAEMLVEQIFDRPKLVLANLIPGRFLFNLTVSNSNLNMIDTTFAELVVLKGKAETNSVEIKCAHMNSFDFGQQQSISIAIQQILEEFIGEKVKINFKQILLYSELAIVRLILYIFYKDEKTVLEAEKIIDILKRDSKFQRDFNVQSISALYCKTSCSSVHEDCKIVANDCACNGLWMPNPIRTFIYGYLSNNCSLPIVGMWLLSLIILLFLTKILQIIWLKQERALKEKSNQFRKLLNYNHNQRMQRSATLIGRFSPLGFFRRVKDAQNNSIKTILKKFDMKVDNTTNAHAMFNEESDCYDEEETSLEDD